MDWMGRGIWREYFISEAAPVIIPRKHLVDRVLSPTTRWVEVEGIGGLGKTTLLEQTAYALDSRGDAVRLVAAPKDAVTLARLFAQAGIGPGAGEATYDENTADESWDSSLSEFFSAVSEEIRGLAGASPSGRFTLLIDDFDWCLARGQIDFFIDLVEEIPELRLVTASLGMLRPLRKRSERLPSLRIGAGELTFTQTDICVLRDAVIPTMRPEGVRALTESSGYLSESTNGFPLAVGIALDRANAEGRDPYDGFTLSPALSALRAEIQKRYPDQVIMGEAPELLWTLSLVPRFTVEHIARMAPNADQLTILQLTELPTITVGKGILAGEFAWTDAAWRSFSAWYAVDSALREKLAVRLREAGDVAGSFEQLLFAEQLDRAERILRRRFMTVFERMSPEAVNHLLGLPLARLRRHPYLRMASVLLDPHTTDADLIVYSDMLLASSRRRVSPELKAMSLSLRSVVLGRLGHWKSAVDQAHEVLSSTRDLDRMGDEQLALAEARIIAVLVTLESGSYPDQRDLLRHPVGDALLDRRRLLAQELLETMSLARPSVRQRRFERKQTGYRALVYEDLRIQQEILAWQRMDDALLEAMHSERPREPLPDLERAPVEKTMGRPRKVQGALSQIQRGGITAPRLLRAAAECIALLVVGNFGDAIVMSRSEEVSPPTSVMLRAVVLLATSRPEEALRVLDAIDVELGARIAAIVATLRAASWLRLGQADASAKMLDGVRDISEAALLFAATMLPEPDLEALAERTPWFSAIADGAKRAGFMGSGRLIPEDEALRPLTKRERDTLSGIVRGFSTKRIAEEYYLSANTVKTHIRSLSKKLGASGRTEIIRRATELGLID